MPAQRTTTGTHHWSYQADPNRDDGVTNPNVVNGLYFNSYILRHFLGVALAATQLCNASIDEEPQFGAPMKKLTVHSGDNVTLTCVVNDIQVPLIMSMT